MRTISQAMKDAEAEITKRVKNAKAEAEEAKLAELEKLRKKHDMLSMSLEEDAKRKTKTLQDELDGARQKAADLLGQLQQLQNASAGSDKDKKKLEDEVAALNKALSAEKERAQKAAQEADAKAKTAAKQAEDQIKQAHQLLEDARKAAQGEQDKLRKEVGDLFLKLQSAEQASKDAAAKLQEELSKGADKLKAQLAEKDAVIAARDKTIAELQKAVKDSEKGASEQVNELKNTYM